MINVTGTSYAIAYYDHVSGLKQDSAKVGHSGKLFQRRSPDDANDDNDYRDGEHDNFYPARRFDLRLMRRP
jgi:hypothetical protein